MRTDDLRKHLVLLTDIAQMFISSAGLLSRSILEKAVDISGDVPMQGALCSPACREDCCQPQCGP